jgi:hypothetical protein
MLYNEQLSEREMEDEKSEEDTGNADQSLKNEGSESRKPLLEQV